jgi:hypothetical protein
VKSGEQDHTWVQCQCCGKIYAITQKISIDTLFVKSVCRCGYDKALNLGHDRDDVYLYINPNVDGRYY